MTDTTWMGEVLQDMAAFAAENDLPETYDALTRALLATTAEARQHKHRLSDTSGNVIPMFMHAAVKISHP